MDCIDGNVHKLGDILTYVHGYTTFPEIPMLVVGSTPHNSQHELLLIMDENVMMECSQNMNEFIIHVCIAIILLSL